MDPQGEREEETHGERERKGLDFDNYWNVQTQVFAVILTQFPQF